jgi:hypothetical protein
MRKVASQTKPRPDLCVLSIGDQNVLLLSDKGLKVQGYVAGLDAELNRGVDGVLKPGLLA